MSELKIEDVDTDSLVPYARNARTHSDVQIAQIMGSIREFGFTNPVLIDETGTIIAGHGRVLAATRLELATVPCLRLAHLTGAQKRAYVIADNQIALNSGWDTDLLSVELGDMQAADIDLGLMGFDESSLDNLLADAGGWDSDIEGIEAAGAHVEGIKKMVRIEVPAEEYDECVRLVTQSLADSGVTHEFKV
jgi:ParB-like chromosome segregation protein Spo0J